MISLTVTAGALPAVVRIVPTANSMPSTTTPILFVFIRSPLADTQPRFSSVNTGSARLADVTRLHSPPSLVAALLEHQLGGVPHIPIGIANGQPPEQCADPRVVPAVLVQQLQHLRPVLGLPVTHRELNE